MCCVWGTLKCKWAFAARVCVCVVFFPDALPIVFDARVGGADGLVSLLRLCVCGCVTKCVASGRRGHFCYIRISS